MLIPLTSFIKDWDISCFLHIGVRFSICIGNYCYHSNSVGSVQDLGTSYIFLNSQGAINYLAVGIA